MTEELFSLLMYYSALSHYKESGDAVLLPDNINTVVVTEATKCLCNLTFNSSKVIAHTLLFQYKTSFLEISVSLSISD
mgnify:FL=1